MTQPSTSSAAASPGPRPPGRSPRAATPSCSTRCGPVRGTEAHHGRRPRRARLLELVPLGRRQRQRRRAAAPGDAHPRLADPARGRRAPGPRRRGAGGRPRGLRRRPSPRRSRRIRSSRIAREEVEGLPPEEWGPAIVATGPLTAPSLARGHPRPDRRRVAGLLRRHRADRAPRLHRHGQGLVPVALRQGRARRHRGRLHQLPDGPGAVRRLHPGPDRRATRSGSRSGRPRRPISTAACRSRSWPSAAPRPCATAR